MDVDEVVGKECKCFITCLIGQKCDVARDKKLTSFAALPMEITLNDNYPR
jgi:hypothetical protein